MKSREKLARDVFYTFVTHSDLVYSVTGSLQTAGYKMSAVTVEFWHFKTSIFDELEQK